LKLTINFLSPRVSFAHAAFTEILLLVALHEDYSILANLAMYAVDLILVSSPD